MICSSYKYINWLKQILEIISTFAMEIVIDEGYYGKRVAEWRTNLPIQQRVSNIVLYQILKERTAWLQTGYDSNNLFLPNLTLAEINS